MLGFEAMFVRHAYLLLFVWVLLEQAGLPIPSLPVMVAAGTMSAAHKLHVAYVLPVVMLALPSVPEMELAPVLLRPMTTVSL